MHDDRAPAARYAVVFREQEGLPTAGALEVMMDRLCLEGKAGDQLYRFSIPFADLSEVRIGRSARERMNGYPVLVLERTQASPVYVAALGVGLLGELAALIAGFSSPLDGRDDRLAVIVPLKRGCQQRVKRLVAKGPPFDPAPLGLSHHRVYLRERELAFLFGGPDVRAKIERVVLDPTLWRAGLAWQGCIAGRPRLAAGPDVAVAQGTLLYSWTAEGEQPS